MLDSDKTIDWIYIENSSVFSYTVPKIIWNGPLNRPLTDHFKMFLSTTLQVWDHRRKTLAPPISLLNIYPGQKWFELASQPGSFSTWSVSQIT